MVGSTYSPDTWQEIQASKVSTSATGIAGTATANTTTNFDLVLTDDIFVRGIEFIAQNQVFGDTLTIQVIDTNGITGAAAGTVLSTPINNWNVPVIATLLSYQAVVPMKALATFTIRLTYTSTSLSTDVNVSINYLLMKPKI